MAPTAPVMEPTTQSVPSTSSLINSAGVSDDEPGAGARLLNLFRRQKQEPELVRYLEQCYERSRTARWRFEKQWFVSLSYYFGKQWITWLNPNTADYARLYEPQAPPWRVRLVINRIKPAIRREMSKVMKEKPTAYVIPGSNEDSDMAGARAGEAIFEHLWRTLKMKDEMWVAQFWRAITGTGFIKDWWDPNPVGTPDGLGQIGVEVPTPFHLFFANLEQHNIDKQEFIIHVTMKSPQEVKTMYGVDVNADSLERGGGVIEAQYLRALNLEPGRVTQVCVKEIWIKPNVRFPRGAMYVWAGGKILYCYEDFEGNPCWPLYKPEYPFTKFAGVPTGRFYGDSTVLDLLPLQKEYNRTRSQIIESKNMMAKPQLMAPAGSIVASKITSEPGQVIFYTPGYEKPTQMKLENLPPYVLQEIDRTLLDMADISGQHEVSTGTVPQGVTAASALSFLQETDDTMIAPIIESLEGGVERLGTHFLCHVHQWWDEPRKVKVLGRDNRWEVTAFSKMDLRDNTDLNVQAGSAMPKSIAAKQAFIMELMKMGAIDPVEGLRWLEMAATGQMYEELQLDRRQAERENLKMSDPSIIPPVNYDNMFNDILSGLLPGAGGAEGYPEPSASSGGPPMLPPGPGTPVPPAMPDGGLGAAGGPADMPPMGGAVPPDMGGGMPPEGPITPDQILPQGPEGSINFMTPTPPPVVPVNSWDDHEIHIKTHNDFRKKQEFEDLPQQLKDEFERHVEQHRAALGLPPSMNPEQMQQLVAAQEAMGIPPAGAAGAGGAPPADDTGGDMSGNGQEAPTEEPAPSGAPL